MCECSKCVAKREVVVCPTKQGRTRVIHRDVIEKLEEHILFVDHVRPQIKRITRFKQIVHRPTVCHRTDGCGYVCGTAKCF